MAKITVEDLDNLIDRLCGFRGELRNNQVGWRDSDEMAKVIEDAAEKIRCGWRDEEG